LLSTRIDVLLGLPVQERLNDWRKLGDVGDVVVQEDDGVAAPAQVGLDEGIVELVAGEAAGVPKQEPVGCLGVAVLPVGAELSSPGQEIGLAVAAG
jgi:hypothetical protein